MLTIQQLELEMKKKDREIERLTNCIETLRNKVNNLTVDSIELNNIKLNKYEKSAKSYTEIIEGLEKEIRGLKDDLCVKDKHYELIMKEMNLKFEKELYTLRTSYENLVGKADNAVANERLCDRQQKHIEIYDELLKALQIEFKTQKSELQIKHEIKFSELKKKMLEHIKDTQKNITQLNLENMDVSTKLILLQNHQLIIELEYQSQQVEELLKKKEALEMKVFEMQGDLEVHQNVENALATKNKTLLDMLKKSEATTAADGFNKSAKSFYEKQPFTNTTNDFTHSFTIYEKKIKGLEKLIQTKSSELNSLKTNYEALQDKLFTYEKKYGAVFNLFEVGIQKLAEDDEIKRNKDLYINVDSLRNCEFHQFSAEQKYSILMVLVKHILPLVNIQSEVKQNLNNVKVRYKEPENSKITENLKFIESLPQIRTSQNFFNFQKKYT
jgi:hypothetical protein